MADFRVRDPATERAILSKLAHSTEASEGGRKRQRDEVHQTVVCRAWAKEGACKFKDRCKFAHGQTGAGVAASNRQLLRDLNEERGPHLVGLGHRADVAAAAAHPEGSGGVDAPDAAAEDDAVEIAATLFIPPVITPASVLARYYTTMFKPDADGTPGNDQYVHIQSNRICVVGLAPSHPIVRCGMTVTSVAFAPAVSAMDITGKRKKGYVFVQANTSMATVKTACGATFNVRAGMRGDVLEINAALLSTPSLLSSHPSTGGHIAVMDVKLSRVMEIHQGLLRQEDYAELCKARGLPATHEQARGWRASSGGGSESTARAQDTAEVRADTVREWV